MQIIPAASGAKALAILPGDTTATTVDVIAWRFDDGGNPPVPIVAFATPGYVRLAVKINEGPRCFEWPSTLHASGDAFVKSIPPF